MKKTKRILPRTKAPKVALLLDMSHESSRDVIRGVFKYARHNGDWRIDLVFGTPNEFSAPDLSKWRGTGAIGRIRDEQTENFFLRSELPLVLIDPSERFCREDSPFFGCSSVDCDSAAVGKAAAEHMIGLGFENYAFVGDRAGSDWSAARGRAFCDEITRRGLNCEVYLNEPTEKRRADEAEEKRLTKFLKGLRTPFGLFAANDWRGVQTLRICRRIGLRVPFDVAVLGVDNDELLCRTARPELSSVGLDSEWAGYEAARILDEQTRGVSSEKETAKYGPTGIVVRGSTRRGGELKNPKVIEALDFIRINAGLGIGVGDVAKRVGLSRQWIEKLFRNERGRAIYEEIQRVRMKTVVQMVVETDLPIGEIGVRCGFVDGNRLGVLFQKRFGASPTEFRAKMRRKFERDDRNENWIERIDWNDWKFDENENEM